MKFRLTTLLLVTTFMAVLLSDILQFCYIVDTKTNFSVIVPKAADEEIVFRLISPRHALIAVGNNAKCRIRLAKSNLGPFHFKLASLETLGEEILPPGNHTVYFRSTTGSSPAEFGFMTRDQPHYVDIIHSAESYTEGATLRSKGYVELRSVCNTRLGFSDIVHYFLIESI